MREFVAQAIVVGFLFALTAAAVLASAWVLGVAWRIFRMTAGLDA